ncbi:MULTISPECIES: hypothetical protein [Sphingomonadales]|uniref:hypothetical protein n=1 Tax=Sphingomonadales TaxID=204457 RepID=UPI000ADD1AB0|nr:MULTISPECIES: hypothetical protein [Sphingomonadales]MCH2236308.1 hypothetical protein [Blastomonas sp.]
MTDAGAHQIKALGKFGLGWSRRTKNIGNGAPFPARKTEFRRRGIEQFAQLAWHLFDQKDDFVGPGQIAIVADLFSIGVCLTRRAVDRKDFTVRCLIVRRLHGK